MSDPRQSLLPAVRTSVADGLNEARADLEPGSKFLRELNRRGHNLRVRYSTILGTASPLTSDQLRQLKRHIEAELAKSRTGRLLEPKVDRFLDDLDELTAGEGDTVVSIRRGQLEGVEDTVVLPIHHWTMTSDGRSPGISSFGRRSSIGWKS